MKASYRGKAILTQILHAEVNDKIIEVPRTFNVCVMAIAGNYAMVRTERAYPFVCKLKELKEI